jgi:hypothetical protein
LVDARIESFNARGMLNHRVAERGQPGERTPASMQGTPRDPLHAVDETVAVRPDYPHTLRESSARYGQGTPRGEIWNRAQEVVNDLFHGRLDEVLDGPHVHDEVDIAGLKPVRREEGRYTSSEVTACKLLLLKSQAKPALSMGKRRLNFVRWTVYADDRNKGQVFSRSPIKDVPRCRRRYRTHFPRIKEERGSGRERCGQTTKRGLDVSRPRPAALADLGHLDQRRHALSSRS